MRLNRTKSLGADDASTFKLDKARNFSVSLVYASTLGGITSEASQRYQRTSTEPVHQEQASQLPNMAQPDYVSLLTSLRESQSTHPLSILTLGEPIINSVTNPPAATTRTSDASDDQNPTPTSLSNDLSHYNDLFKKLRFSYLEQVTKEKFLRSIVGDPPLLVSHADNARLEEELVRQKAELKGRKDEVKEFIEQMGKMARKLAERYQVVQTQMRQLEILPGEVEEMQARVQLMQEELQAKMGNQQAHSEPRMNLGLEETDVLVKETQSKAREIEKQIAALQRQLPAKMRECEVVERELEGLERMRNEKTAAAREARRIKEEGGRDMVEEMGQWYRSKETVLRGLLDVEVEG